MSVVQSSLDESKMDERMDTSTSGEDSPSVNTCSGSLARSLFTRSQPLTTLNEESRGNEDIEDDEIGSSSGPESPVINGTVADNEGSGIKAEHEEREDTPFDAMLRSVRTDMSLLALSTTELTSTKLSLVCDALHDSALVRADRQQDDEDAQSPISAITDVDRLRVLIAVDILRLLIERFHHHDVKSTVEEAVRERYSFTAASTGVAALAKAPTVLTTHNITEVVLTARRHLMDQFGHQSIACCPVSDTPKPRLELVFPTRILHTTPSSLSKRSPASSVHASTTGSARHPVSILASDGDHVLMQERLARYEHRGQSPVKGSVLRVRRDGTDVTDAAAKRRSRALEYAATRQRPLAAQL